MLALEEGERAARARRRLLEAPELQGVQALSLVLPGDAEPQEAAPAHLGQGLAEGIDVLIEDIRPRSNPFGEKRMHRGIVRSPGGRFPRYFLTAFLACL
jgi:hypothetical protein